MPANSTPSALPRQELALAVVEGANSVKNLIWDKILGPLPLTWRNAHLVKATLADSLGLRHIAADMYKHAPGTKFNRLTATFGDASLTVDPRGVEIAVPNEMILDYRNRFEPLAFFAGRFGNQIAGLTVEFLAAAQIFNTSNFGSATAAIANYTATNASYAAFVAGTGINFIGDIIAATRRLKASGEAGPYKVVLSGPVAERARQTFGAVQYAKGIWGAQREATMADLANALREFGIEEICIGDAYYNNAADQATPSLSQIWSNTYIWVGTAGMTPASDGTDQGVGVPIISGVGAMTFWEGYAPGGVPSADKTALDFSGGGGFYVEEYPSLETDSYIIRLKMSHKPTILNSRAGTLIATSYS